VGGAFHQEFLCAAGVIQREKHGLPRGSGKLARRQLIHRPFHEEQVLLRLEPKQARKARIRPVSWVRCFCRKDRDNAHGSRGKIRRDSHGFTVVDFCVLSRRRAAWAAMGGTSR